METCTELPVGKRTEADCGFKWRFVSFFTFLKYYYVKGLEDHGLGCFNLVTNDLGNCVILCICFILCLIHLVLALAPSWNLFNGTNSIHFSSFLICSERPLNFPFIYRGVSTAARIWDQTVQARWCGQPFSIFPNPKHATLQLWLPVVDWPHNESCLQHCGCTLHFFPPNFWVSSPTRFHLWSTQPKPERLRWWICSEP